MKSFIRLLASLTLGWLMLIPTGLLAELAVSPWLGATEFMHSDLVLPTWGFLAWRAYRLFGLLPFFDWRAAEEHRLH